MLHLLYDFGLFFQHLLVLPHLCLQLLGLTFQRFNLLQYLGLVCFVFIQIGAFSFKNVLEVR